MVNIMHVENCYLSWKNSFTDVMKLNVHPTNYHTHTHTHTHIIMLKLSRITMQSKYVWIAMSTCIDLVCAETL